MTSSHPTGKKRTVKRLVDFPRCNALDDDGRRCRKHSGIEAEYHGSSELYKGRGTTGTEVHWVAVNLCIDHAIGIGYDCTLPIKHTKKTI